MMKKLLLLFVALVAGAMSAYAQNELPTATLQHGEDMTVYTGVDALSKAYNAAVDGDVITLSEGTFSSIDIQKDISIYGAGFEPDEETGTGVTTITGKAYVSLYGLTRTGMHLEGLYFDNEFNFRGGNTIEKLKDFTLKKCYLSNRIWNSVDTLENVIIDQCVLNGLSTGDVYGENASTVFKNLVFTHCYINGPIFGYNSDLSYILMDHCISNAVYVLTYGQGNKQVWTNSIFVEYNTADNRGLCGTSSTIINCLARQTKFPTATTVENLYVEYQLSDIFTDEAASQYSPTRTFELVQPNTWVGTDGTQVGLHGTTGWSKVPGIPVVKNLQLNVDGSTLNVTYEAEAR